MFNELGFGGQYGEAEYARDCFEIEELKKAGVPIPYIKYEYFGIVHKFDLNPRGDQAFQALERFKAKGLEE